MRISQRYSVNTLSDSLAISNRRIQRLTEQVTSGKAITRPSDDPAAAGRVLRAQATLGEVQSRQAAFETVQQQLGMADNALGEITSSLRRACDIAIQGGQNTTQADEYPALAEEVRGLASHLQTLGNVSDGFVYAFGGRANTSTPLVKDATMPGGVRYVGDTQAVVAPIAPGETARVGATAADVFNFADPTTGSRPIPLVANDVFGVLKSLSDALDAGDSDAVSAAGEQLQTLEDHAVSVRGTLGLQGVRFTTADEEASAEVARVQGCISTDSDVDLVTAVTELKTQQTAYQGALSAAAQALQLPTLWQIMK
jgi:flagellar hook-associated protein 3 FlgL